MEFVSTRGRAPAVSFTEALHAGLAPDGGLYVPASIPALALNEWRGGSAAEIATAMLTPFVGTALSGAALGRLLADALDFPLPVVPLDEGTRVLELFHGPTCAFKDVGARVMARLMTATNDAGGPLTVLVATSGDTGGAVAQAFGGVPGTRVVVLFPADGVTPLQQAQFTTLGGNVSALAVKGTFDDCQRLAKHAFADRALRDRVRLTSANSINLGRLLPQMIYFASAALAGDRPVVYSVPSGNFGNLAAGIMARLMGAPIAGFVAATTINDTVPRYLESGRYEPRPSVPTLANAMDVGDPSNLERLRWFVGDDLDALRAFVTASVHTDAEVRDAIRLVWERYGYVCDPHTAIAYLGLTTRSAADGVFLATAHPAKFRETVEPLIGGAVALPASLAAALERRQWVETIAADYSSVRDRLMAQ